MRHGGTYTSHKKLPCSAGAEPSLWLNAAPIVLGNVRIFVLCLTAVGHPADTAEQGFGGRRGKVIERLEIEIPQSMKR